MEGFFLFSGDDSRVAQLAVAEYSVSLQERKTE